MASAVTRQRLLAEKLPIHDVASQPMLAVELFQAKIAHCDIGQDKHGQGRSVAGRHFCRCPFPAVQNQPCKSPISALLDRVAHFRCSKALVGVARSVKFVAICP